MTKKKSNLVLLIIALFSILLVIGVGVTAYYTDGYDSIFHNKTLSVGVKNTKITENMALDFEEDENFRVDINMKDFKVQIIPNSDNNFDYKVNEVLSCFTDINDFSKAFNVKVYEDYFTLNTLKRSFEEIFSAQLGEQKFEGFPNPDKVVYFKIKITSNDKVVILDLRNLVKVYVSNITLDETRIYL